MSDKAKPGPGLGMERIAWHSFPLGDVFVHLNSKRDGLSTEEAESRLKHFGRNILKPEKPASWGKVFVRQFANPLVLVLLAAFGLAIFGGTYIEAVGLLIVALINCFLGVFWELGLVKNLKNIHSAETLFAMVKRAGEPRKISAEEVAPGDVIIIGPGDVVPADARLIRSFNLEVDESTLTGEYDHVVKLANPLPINLGVGERANIIFAASVVVCGTAEAVVFDTGRNLEIRQYYKDFPDIRRLPRPVTPFKKRIYKLGWFVAAVSLALCAAAAVWGFLFEKTWAEAARLAAGLMAVSSPQSLFLAVAIILVTGLNRIFKKHGLAKSPDAIEFLGSSSVIILDGTGILSRGDLTVAKILTPERIGGIFEFNATPQYGSNHILVLSYGLLTAEAVVENAAKDPNDWVIHAQPMGQALIRAGLEAGLDWEKLNKKFKKVGEITFDYHHKFSVSFRENPEGEIWALVLGSPDVLLSRIKKIQIINRAENIISSEHIEIKEAVENLSRSGLRVAVICAKKIENKNSISSFLNDEKIKDTISDLTLVGMLGFNDSTRPETAEFLSLARRAGIKTVLTTYDRPLTALAAARSAKLLPKGRSLPEIMDGKDVDTMDLRELSQKVRNIDIFCRLNPEHKVKIAQAWQQQGETVIVCGSSSGDIPVLKQADVSVAPVTAVGAVTETAGLLLLQPSYANLIQIIRESRLVWQKLRKIVTLTLSLGLGEAIMLLLASVWGWNLPLSIIQIIIANFILTGLMVIAAAFSPTWEKGVMDWSPDEAQRPFMDSFTRFFVSASGVAIGLTLFTTFYFFKTYFENFAYAQSVVFLALGIIIFVFSFSVQGLPRPMWDSQFVPDKVFFGFTAAGLLIMIFAIYLPPLNNLLETQPVGFLEWIVVLGAGLLDLIFMETAKWFYIRRHGQNRLAP